MMNSELEPFLDGAESPPVRTVTLRADPIQMLEQALLLLRGPFTASPVTFVEGRDYPVVEADLGR
jgi:hypothetical protein